MTSGIKNRWRKRLAVWRTRLYLYSAPEPLPRSRAYWIATSIVALLVVLFAAYFICYLIAKQDAFLTNAEDLGIMDQAIWNTLHGHLLQQTICNVVNDTNCAGFQGLSRFALHFEPMLLPISLLYLIWPNPNTLLIIQTLIVASGAFPAFWLARLRLRNEWAGVAIALLYLLYPAQQNALVFDFHAVTLTAALLLYTLYFLYTHKTAWLFLFAILSMACKEEIPLLIVGFGLWSILFQHRWRSGFALILLAMCWIGLAILFLHLYSPSGNPLLLSRYSYLGSTPYQMLYTLLRHPFTLLNKHVWERTHLAYLSTLFAPAGYLPLLAPWVLLLALPTLFLNLFSTDPTMYSGLFQYNAEIVPILIFATIEAMVMILWVARWCHNVLLVCTPIGANVSHTPLPQDAHERYPMGVQLRKTDQGTRYRQSSVGADLSQPTANSLARLDRGKIEPQDTPMNWRWAAINRPLPVFYAVLTGRPWNTPRGYPGVGAGEISIIALTIYILFSVLSLNVAHSELPFAQHFHWPYPTAHTELVQHFIDLIPPTASVSVQTRLVPHLSQRGSIYLFPYGDDRAQYILLDITSDRYPYMSAQAYEHEVDRVLRSGVYGIVAAENGYLLLERGLPPPFPISQAHST